MSLSCRNCAGWVQGLFCARWCDGICLKTAFVRQLQLNHAWLHSPLSVSCAIPAQPCVAQGKKVKFTSWGKKCPEWFYWSKSNGRQKWLGNSSHWGFWMGAPYSRSEWQMDLGKVTCHHPWSSAAGTGHGSISELYHPIADAVWQDFAVEPHRDSRKYCELL